MNSRNKWLQTLPASVPVILFMFTVKQFYYVLGYFNLVSVSVEGNLNHVGYFIYLAYPFTKKLCGFASCPKCNMLPQSQ